MKVFGIGLNKTGTTTLGHIGKHLGLRCTSCDEELLADFVLRNDFKRIFERVEDNDLFEDWPWPFIYKQLDARYPGSKFILTVRKSESVWFESLCKHSLRTHPFKHCRKLAFGFNFPERNKEEHLNLYRQHNAAVREYFRGRNNDFIELCWENGDGVEQVCRFLNMDRPVAETPHANRGSDAEAPRNRLLVNRVLSFLNF
jgi:hypothetical protein